MSGLKKSQHLSLPFKDIEVATNNFETCIGKGGYGLVYKGEVSIAGKPTTVAVKRLNEQFGQGLKEFLTEIDLLAGQQHPNLISLLGYCDEGNEKIIVYEYADRGSLEQYIRYSSTTSYTLTWLERLKICVDAARGLGHLHSHVGRHQCIIHRDIKSANILLDENWVAKISDLGLARLSLAGLDRSVVISNVCGTFSYVDPEYLFNGIVTKKSDVYSFGMVLFEVLCGKSCTLRDDDGFLLSAKLAKKYYKKKRLDEIINPSLRELMSSLSMNKFSEIAYRCLHDDREQRPPMDVVKKELEEALIIQLQVSSDKGSIGQSMKKYWSQNLLPQGSTGKSMMKYLSQNLLPQGSTGQSMKKYLSQNLLPQGSTGQSMKKYLSQNLLPQPEAKGESSGTGAAVGGHGDDFKKDGGLWFRDIGKYSGGEYSMAVVQANSVLEDQSQIESGSFGTFVGVYDGHGGPDAARYICDNLFRNFEATSAENYGVVTPKIISNAFLQTENGFTSLVSELFHARPRIATVGSCCLVGVIYQQALFIANLGDSRVVLGKKDSNTGGMMAIQLSSEHNVGLEDARNELINLHPHDPQIVAFKHGVWRVKGIIQVSRSIGDVYMKHAEYNNDQIKSIFRLPEGTTMPVLSATPSITTHDIHPNDSFLIFASDGLWEHLSNAEAVEIVHDNPHAGIAKRLVKAALGKAAKKLELRYSDLRRIDKGVRRHFHDDITVIVLFLHHDQVSLRSALDQY